MPAIPAPGKLRQGDGKSESSIGYTVRLFKKQKNPELWGHNRLSFRMLLPLICSKFYRQTLFHHPSPESALSVPSSAEVARPSGAPKLWLLPLAAHAREHLCKYSFCLHFFLFSFLPFKIQPLTFFSYIFFALHMNIIIVLLISRTLALPRDASNPVFFFFPSLV